jgi:ribosomal protein S14
MGALHVLVVGSIPSTSTMQHKLKQQLNREKYTTSNRLPALRSRQFLLNALRLGYTADAAEDLRVARGRIRLDNRHYFLPQNRVAFRSACFVTGRGRATSQRYSVSRFQVKKLSGQGKLFGARKSS